MADEIINTVSMSRYELPIADGALANAVSRRFGPRGSGWSPGARPWHPMLLAIRNTPCCSMVEDDRRGVQPEMPS